MAVMNRPYGYSMIESEDPEETKHRLAQFLIYKAMQKADGRRRPSWLRVRVFKLKIKIAIKLKKRLSSTLVFSSKALLKYCKYFLHGKQEPIVRTLPPL